MPERTKIVAKHQIKYAGIFGLGCWLSGGVEFVHVFNSKQAYGTIHKLAKEIKKKDASYLLLLFLLGLLIIAIACALSTLE